MIDWLTQFAAQHVKSYGSWLVAVSLLVMALERLFPWRRGQPLLRPLLLQDVLWFVLNGFVIGGLLHPLMSRVGAGLGAAYGAAAGTDPARVLLLAGLPLAAQTVLVLVVADLVEWIVHNLLHRVGVLWRFHRVHHSIHVMDWIGNFRFHFVEIIVYNTIKHLPLTVLGVSWQATLIAAVFATLIGHLNHANLDLSWGPLRYVLNSPRMHLWHHDATPDVPAGYNFAVVFSAWDWMFGTAHMPRRQTPERIGFGDDAYFPDALWWRLLVPFASRRQMQPNARWRGRIV